MRFEGPSIVFFVVGYISWWQIVGVYPISTCHTDRLYLARHVDAQQHVAHNSTSATEAFVLTVLLGALRLSYLYSTSSYTVELQLWGPCAREPRAAV